MSFKQRETAGRFEPRVTGNKVETMDKATIFVCEVNPNAKDVFLVGDFNSWNPMADRMIRRKGVFRKAMQLAPGEYQYKFLVDGVWHNDPAAAAQVPNQFGTQNSVVRVQETTDI